VLSVAFAMICHDREVLRVERPEESSGAGRRLRAHVQPRLRERPRTAWRGERARPVPIDDYNHVAPHLALGMRSLADYQAVTSANCELMPTPVWEIGEQIRMRADW